MKRHLTIILALISMVEFLSPVKVAAQGLGFKMTSTFEGQPIQRQFNFSPALKVKSGPFTFPLADVFTTLVNGEQEISAHVGTPSSGMYLDKNKWYKIKLSGFHCYEYVFRIYYFTNYKPDFAPKLNWNSTRLNPTGWMEVTDYVPILFTNGDYTRTEYYQYEKGHFSPIIQCTSP